jgi:hypothetical protein
MEPFVQRLLNAIRLGKEDFRLTPIEYGFLSDQVNVLGFRSEFTEFILRSSRLRLAPNDIILKLPFRIKGPAEYFISADKRTIIILTLDINPIKIVNLIC